MYSLVVVFLVCFGQAILDQAQSIKEDGVSLEKVAQGPGRDWHSGYARHNGYPGSQVEQSSESESESSSSSESESESGFGEIRIENGHTSYYDQNGNQITKNGNQIHHNGDGHNHGMPPSEYESESESENEGSQYPPYGGYNGPYHGPYHGPNTKKVVLDSAQSKSATVMGSENETGLSKAQETQAKSSPEHETETENEREDEVAIQPGYNQQPYSPLAPDVAHGAQYPPYAPGYVPPQYMPPTQPTGKHCYENGIEVNCNGGPLLPPGAVHPGTEKESESESETEDGFTETETEKEFENGNREDIYRTHHCYKESINGIQFEVPCAMSPQRGPPGAGGPPGAMHPGTERESETETETETEDGFTESQTEHETQPVLRKSESLQDPRKAEFMSELLWVGSIGSIALLIVCVTVSVCCRKAKHPIDNRALTLDQIEDPTPINQYMSHHTQPQQQSAGNPLSSHPELHFGYNKYLDCTEV